MKKLELTKNKYALVDDFTYIWAKRFNWYLHLGKYAVRTVWDQKKQKAYKAYLHREILHAQIGEEVDHINGNTLDYRIKNLRYCSHKQNSYNRKKPTNNTSGYKGVNFHKQTNQWRARIHVDKTEIPLGLYDSKEEAALAYDMASIFYHKEFSRRNLY